jgi:hypothetical protein
MQGGVLAPRSARYIQLGVRVAHLVLLATTVQLGAVTTAAAAGRIML